MRARLASTARVGGSFVAYNNKAILKNLCVKQVFEGETDAERDLFMRRIGKMVERLNVDAKRKSSRLKAEEAVAYLDARFDKVKATRERLDDDMVIYQGLRRHDDALRECLDGRTVLRMCCEHEKSVDDGWPIIIFMRRFEIV